MRTLLAFGVAVLLLAPAFRFRAAAGSTLIGDVNGDCTVNVSDLSLVGSRYLTGIGSLLYAVQYDLNRDGAINIFDIQIVAAHYLQHC